MNSLINNNESTTTPMNNTGFGPNPKGLGVFAKSPNLLIWLFEKQGKNKMYKIRLVAKRNERRLPPALLFIY